jgi:hypothetical protein
MWVLAELVHPAASGKEGNFPYNTGSCFMRNCCLFYLLPVSSSPNEHMHIAHHNMASSNQQQSK